MGTITATGGSILLDQVAGDRLLHRQLAVLHPGDSVVLEVGGFVGRWRRTTSGLEPLDQNVRDAWLAMTDEPAHAVAIQLVTTDGSHLVTFGTRGQLWDDPESQYR